MRPLFGLITTLCMMASSVVFPLAIICTLLGIDSAAGFLWACFLGICSIGLPVLFLMWVLPEPRK